MPDWETIEAPRGSFIGWGTKAGQTIQGKVLDYNVVGGTDFNGNTCPQIDIELTEPAESFNKAGDMFPHTTGDFVTVTAGLVDLSRRVKAADPAPGDLIKIQLSGVEALAGGHTVKRFIVQMIRNGGKKNVKPAPAIRGGAAGFDQDDSDLPPF